MSCIRKKKMGIDYNVMADFLTHLVNIQRHGLAGVSLVVIHLGGISLYIYFYPLNYFFLPEAHF